MASGTISPPVAQRAQADSVVRAMTNDGAFRVIGIVATQTAQEVIARQEAIGDDAIRLAELVTAAVLIRETTQPTRRVQLIWHDDRGQTFIADSLTDGNNRGLITKSKDEDAATRVSHMLQVNYTLRNGALHQSMISVPPGENVSAALMRYMQESEQTVCIAQIAAIPNGGANAASIHGPIRAVGGYLVQLLPEATVEVMGEMTDKIGNLPVLSQWLENARDARGIIATILSGFEYTELASNDLRFGCTCSEERFIIGILTLPDTEVEEILADPVIDVTCDACSQKYAIPSQHVRDMQTAQKRRFQA